MSLSPRLVSGTIILLCVEDVEYSKKRAYEEKYEFHSILELIRIENIFDPTLRSVHLICQRCFCIVERQKRVTECLRDVSEMRIGRTMERTARERKRESWKSLIPELLYGLMLLKKSASPFGA